MESLASLVSSLGLNKAKELITNRVTYPDTNVIDKYDPLLGRKEFYDGGSLSVVVNHLLAEATLYSKDLKGTVDDTICALKLIASCQDQILLSQADTVAIYRGGFCVLIVENKSQRVDSGKSISLELNTIRYHLQKKCHNQFMETSMLLSVGACITLVAIMLFVQKSNK
jgi:hypothetical protein